MSALPQPPAPDAVLDWVFPEAHTVVAVHRRLQAEFGGAGHEAEMDLVRVSAMLVEITGIAHIADKRADAPVLAACLMAACLRLRPARDGNRRLGFALAMLFLRLNHIDFPVSAEEKYRFAARFGYPGVDSRVFADWIRMRLIALRTGAGTVVRVRTRGRQVEGVTVLRTAKASAPPRLPPPPVNDT